MNLEKLDKIFELTKEVLLTYDSDDSHEKDVKAIQQLELESIYGLWS